MRHYSKDGFVGVYAPDTIKNIQITNIHHIFFIMNILPTAPIVGHWVAINIINTPETQTLEYYDPFGNEPYLNFKPTIKPLLRKLSKQKFQFKINCIQDQTANSTKCGYFAMNFLVS